MRTNPQVDNLEADVVLAKVVLKASEQLGLKQKELANVLGVHQTSVSRLKHNPKLSPSSKHGEQALMLISVGRAMQTNSQVENLESDVGLAKAVLEATEQLGLKPEDLANVLGVRRAFVSHLKQNPKLSPSSKQGEQALMRIRLALVMQTNPRVENLEADARLAKAVLKASKQWGLKQKDLANVLGVQRAFVSRRKQNPILSPSSKQGEKALMQERIARVMKTNPRVENLEADVVLAKAVLKASDKLGLKQKELANVLGVNRPDINRLKQNPILSPSSKQGEKALMLIRVAWALSALTGGDEVWIKRFMHYQNSVTNGIPAKQIESVEGLTIVLRFVETLRGKI